MLRLYAREWLTSIPPKVDEQAWEPWGQVWTAVFCREFLRDAEADAMRVEETTQRCAERSQLNPAVRRALEWVQIANVRVRERGELTIPACRIRTTHASFPCANALRRAEQPMVRPTTRLEIITAHRKTSLELALSTEIRWTLLFLFFSLSLLSDFECFTSDRGGSDDCWDGGWGRVD